MIAFLAEHVFRIAALWLLLAVAAYGLAAAVWTAAGVTVELSQRQLEVLEGVLAGQSNRQIATATHLTEGTIKNHVSSLLLMFGVRSRAELISQLR